MEKNARNLTLNMDLYELTMANGFFLEYVDKPEEIMNQKVLFDVFYRKNPDRAGFSIFAGLEQVVDYIKNFHFDPEDIQYLKSLKSFDDRFLDFLSNLDFDIEVTGFREGTITYPNEPLITVKAPIIVAQLLETAILNQINHQSLIATKANRIVRAANGAGVSDFGARRAHNADAAILGARAAYIGGVSSTATVLAGQEFGIPVSGTMAHSWVMFHKNEKDAFKNFVDIYPDNAILLIDTYDTLKSGLPNAIATFKYLFEKLGRRPKNYGIRIDSGDLAYQSKEIRERFDNEDMKDAKIIVSNSLDECTIRSLIDQGAKIDAYGVGERLITSKSEPVFGAVYKLAGIIKKDFEDKEFVVPTIKVSGNVEKITNPGLKYVYRLYNSEGYSIGDIISGINHDEDYILGFGHIKFINPESPWKHIMFTNDVKVKKLTEPIFVRKNGKVEVDMFSCSNLEKTRQYVKDQLEHHIWEEEQRFENPHKHPIYFDLDYYNMKMKLLSDYQA